MSTSAIIQIENLRQASSDGEITPDRLATILRMIYDECHFDQSDLTLPEHLDETYIEQLAIAATKWTEPTETENQFLNAIGVTGIAHIPFPEPMI